VVLSTVNPLFLDSTKPIGDKVVTNVELTHILLHDGESLFFEVMDSFGFAQKFELREMTTKKSAKFKAEVWLKYRHQIQYRFVIESAGLRLFVSALHDTLAGHVISEKWEPCFESTALAAPADKVSSRRSDFIKTIKPAREIKSKSSKELFKPQLFDQIKSLLDDLL
jgi:hypothetical protein